MYKNQLRAGAEFNELGTGEVDELLSTDSNPEPLL